MIGEGSFVHELAAKPAPVLAAPHAGHLVAPTRFLDGIPAPRAWLGEGRKGRRGRGGGRGGWPVRLSAANPHLPHGTPPPSIDIHTYVHIYKYTYLGETANHCLILQLLLMHPLLVLRATPPYMGITVKITKPAAALPTLHLRFFRVSQDRRLTPWADTSISVFFLKLKPLILGPGLRPDQRLDIPFLNSFRAGRRNNDRCPPTPYLPPPPPRVLAKETGGLDLTFANLAFQVRGETTPTEPVPTPREPERLAHPLILPTDGTKHQLLPQVGLDYVDR